MRTDDQWFEPAPGSHIDHACKEAVAMAMNKGGNVHFNFNGVDLVATPNSTPGGLLRQWNAEMDRRRAEHEASPEYAAQKSKESADLLLRQRRVDTFLEGVELLTATCSLDEVLSSLRPFVADADHIGVKFDKAKLADIFEAGGYKESAHVGKPPECFNEREIMGEYILGQVVNCLRRGMPPHPVTLRFIEDYFKLPEIKRCVRAAERLKEPVREGERG